MRKYLYTFLALSLMLSCVEEKPFVAESPESDAGAADYTCSRSVVRFTDEMAAMIEESSSSEDFLAEFGVASMERLFPDGGEFEQRRREAGLHKWYVVNFDEPLTLTKAAAVLPGAETVEPVVPVVRTAMYDDPDFAKQWGLENVVSESGYRFDINVAPVWANYTKGTSNVKVAIIDAGVDVAHEDLAYNCAETHYNAIRDVAGPDVIEPDEHGTHVAGIVAATGNNGIGVAGVAGGDHAAQQKGATIISCQIFNPDGSSSADGLAAARAMTWAADNGAVISQNSWGYHADLNADGKISEDEKQVALVNVVKDYHKDAIDYFIRNAGCDKDGNQLPDSPMKGGVVIFAAGNDALENGAPANYEPVIAVGSIASDGSRSTFSNFGSWVDIAAPGTDIYSTIPDNKYKSLEGTSMACPFVSGVAALVVSHCGKLGFTNEMLKERLVKSANTGLIPSSLGIGGLVDAMGAITYGEDKTPSKVTGLSGNVKSNFVNLEWTAPADEDGKPAYGYLVLYSKDQDKLAAATAENHSEVGYNVCVSYEAAGQTVKHTIRMPEFDSDYYFKVIAYSYGMNYAEASEVITLSTLCNNAPVVENRYEGSGSISPYQTLVIPVAVEEVDGHACEVSLIDAPENVEFKTPATEGGDYKIVIAGSVVKSGTYTVKVKVVDEYGLSTEIPITFTVFENRAPVKTKEMDDIRFSEKGEVSFDLAGYVSDADGEQLKYSITVSDSKVAHAVTRGNMLYVSGINYGHAVIEITASDIRGEKVVLRFHVMMQDETKPVNIYPAQVTRTLNVVTLSEEDASVWISDGSGQILFSTKGRMDIMSPLQVDMGSYAPGVYSVTVAVDGKKHRQNVVKL